MLFDDILSYSTRFNAVLDYTILDDTILNDTVLYYLN